MKFWELRVRGLELGFDDPKLFLVRVLGFRVERYFLLGF